ncbi:MAG: type II secretion system protein GspG [Pirellulales bacterium]|nr:type II secretion system protein GspG [Pirellulales bacterium]
MPAFPRNASLQETVDFVRTQFLAGHPEVIWHALPTDVRQKLDSQEVRDVMLDMVVEQQPVNKAMLEIGLKVTEVLTTQKDFVLNSPLLARIPPEAMPMVQQAYDPAAGFIYELMIWICSLDELSDATVTEWVDSHGPRLGGHIRALLEVAPKETIDAFFDRVTVKQLSEAAGTITMPDIFGGSSTVEMVRHDDGWLPASFAKEWVAKKDSMVQFFKDQKAEAKRQNPQMAAQATLVAGMITGVGNQLIEPLRTAKTQAEFDQGAMALAALIEQRAPWTAAREARIEATRVQMNSVKQAISYYRIRMNAMPANLDVLRDGPKDAKLKARWTGPILSEVPLDAWERPFEYTLKNNKYTIRSTGPDGVSGNDDDLTIEGP